jgi:hypothetical protein
MTSLFLCVDEFINEIYVPSDTFASREPRHFHVPIFEYVNFNALTNECDRDQDRVGAMSLQCEMNAGALKCGDKLEQWMAHSLDAQRRA